METAGAAAATAAGGGGDGGRRQYSRRRRRGAAAAAAAERRRRRRRTRIRREAGGEGTGGGLGALGGRGGGGRRAVDVDGVRVGGDAVLGEDGEFAATFAAGESAGKPDAAASEPEGVAEDAPSTRTVDAESSTVGRKVSEERSWGMFTS